VSGTPILFLVVAVGAAFAYFAYMANQKRVAALKLVAGELGFAYLPRDPGNVLSMPFRFLQQGSAPKVRDFLVGERNGRAMQLFNFQYTTSSGSNSSTVHKFTCGILTISAACPYLGIGHENFLTRLAAHVGVHDVSFESNEFNERFRVRCADQRFAFSLIDAAMMEWLMTTPSEIKTIEMDGPWVFAVAPPLSPQHWPDLVGFFDEFVSHVPSVVYTTYPAR
jgi:hypothetical protein